MDVMFSKDKDGVTEFMLNTEIVNNQREPETQTSLFCCISIFFQQSIFRLLSNIVLAKNKPGNQNYAKYKKCNTVK